MYICIGWPAFEIYYHSISDMVITEGPILHWLRIETLFSCCARGWGCRLRRLWAGWGGRPEFSLDSDMQLKDSSLVWTQFLPVRSYIGLHVQSPLWDLMRVLPLYEQPHIYIYIYVCNTNVILCTIKWLFDTLRQKWAALPRGGVGGAVGDVLYLGQGRAGRWPPWPSRCY